MHKRLPTALIIVSLILAAATQSAPAQNWFAGGGDKKQGKQRRKVAPLRTDRVTRPFDIPDLPDFNGQKVFLGGDLHPADNGASYVQRFATNAHPQQVLDFYKQNFSSYGWKMRYQTEESISAGRKGNFATVQVQKSQMPRENCRYSINCFIWQPKK